MQQVMGVLEQVIEQIAQVADSDVVAGEPLELGGVTVVVLSRVSLGLGGGGGQGSGEGTPGKPGGQGTGGGAGGGAKVRPVAVVAFAPDGVEILPVPDKPGLLDKLFDKVPDVIDLVKQVKGLADEGEKKKK